MQTFFRLIFITLFLSIITVSAQETTSTINIGAAPTTNAIDIIMILDQDGLPIIGYYNTNRASLEIARCQDLKCAQVPRITILDRGDAMGVNAVLLDQENRPHVVYTYYARQSNVNELKLASCSTPDCNDISLTTLDSSARYVTASADFDSEDTLFIFYKNDENDAFRLIRCPLGDCADSQSETILEGSTIRPALDIEIDKNDNPRISFVWNIALQLEYGYCSVPDCSEGQVITIDDEGYGSVDSAEMVLTSTGNPVFAYYSQDDNGAMLVTCQNELCEKLSKKKIGNMRTISSISLTIDENDNPVVAYIDDSPGTTYLIVCSDPLCEESASRSFRMNASYASVVLREDNTPVVAIGNFSRGEKGIKVIDCDSPTCKLE